MLWRAPEHLPEELVFHVNYLGGDQASFTLNFSKSAAQIVGQFYQFVCALLAKPALPKVRSSCCCCFFNRDPTIASRSRSWASVIGSYVHRSADLLCRGAGEHSPCSLLLIEASTHALAIAVVQGRPSVQEISCSTI